MKSTKNPDVLNFLRGYKPVRFDSPVWEPVLTDTHLFGGITNSDCHISLWKIEKGKNNKLTTSAIGQWCNGEYYLGGWRMTGETISRLWSFLEYPWGKGLIEGKGNVRK